MTIIILLFILINNLFLRHLIYAYSIKHHVLGVYVASSGSRFPKNRILKKYFSARHQTAILLGGWLAWLKVHFDYKNTVK